MRFPALFSIILLIPCLHGFCQSSAQKDAIIKSKMDSLQRSGTFLSDTLERRFLIDTCQIEFTEDVYMWNEMNDYNMRDITSQAGSSYDKLLNKYYKKLYNKLKEQDRAVLIRTQKAWISFRDEELKLYDTINTESNGGGGTAATVAFAFIYLNLTKSRTIDLFNFYRDLTYRY